MDIEVTYTHPAGKYYVGDICYALPKSIYKLVWGEKLKYAYGTHEAEYNGVTSKFSVNRTMWGDGRYYDDYSDLEFGVDAGVIGLVPIALCDTEKLIDGKIRGGHMIESSTPIEYHSEEGIFHISYENNTKVIEIDTGDGSDDEYESETETEDDDEETDSDDEVAS
jgi:hypothetical protein